MADTQSAPRVDAATRRYYAVLADCDPRSIDKVLAGQPVRGLAGRRIRAALEAAGIAVPHAEAEK